MIEYGFTRRKVKKPKHPLPTEITAPLSGFLVLIST